MVKNTNTKILILTAIILLLSAGVMAQSMEIITYSNDDQQVTQPAAPSENVYINKYSADYLFSISASEQNPQVCLCSTTTDKIYITNDAPYEATFTIITNLPEYVSLQYSSIRLGAGKTAEIKATISADCAERSGKKDYNILVSNNFGTQYTLERQLVVDRCQSIEAKLYASSNQIKPCEKVNYTVELKNVGPFIEQYVIRPKAGIQFGNTVYEITLAPNQKSFFNFVYAPECGIYGQKDIIFLIDSVNNELTAKLSHELTIERAYDFSVTTTNDLNLCRGKQELIPVNVKNLAGVDNIFYFTIVNKQDFLDAKDSELVIAAGEEKTFFIEANPTPSTKTNQVIDYEIKTDLGDLSYRGKINLINHDCFNLNVNIISDNNPTLCAGTYTYDVEVENKGAFEETIILTEESEYAELFPSKIELKPGEKKTVSLALSLPNENKNELPFKVVAYIEGEIGIWEDSLKVNVKEQHECTLLEYSTDKFFARYGTQNLTFYVENKGTLVSEYKIKLTGPDFIDLETKKVVLKPGESTPVVLSLYADDSEVLRKYDFTVKATADNGESYESEMTLKMADIPLLQRLYNKATTNMCTTATSILLILLILAVIAVVILAWKKVRIPLAVKLLAAALIVLIIMVVLVTQGFPESRAPAIDKTLVNNSNLVWHEDKSYEVELNSYFYDPDNDTMTFSVEDVPENITVEIDGNKATLTPDKDWSGTARIRFMATDGYGGEIESGRIDIEVVEVPEFSAVRMYMMNCVFWNALLLIIILALVFLLKTRKQEKEGTKKVHRAGIKKQKGFLYFVDKDGDVSRTPMARSNKKNQKFKKEKVGKVTRK